METKFKSYLWLTIAQCCIGLNIVIVKYLIPVIPIYLLFTIRFMVGAILLGTMALIRQENPLQDQSGQSLGAFDWLVIFAQALCAGFLFNILIVSGLHYTEANTAGAIASIVPAVIALLSFFLLKESLGPRRIMAIILAVIGILIINLGKHQEGQGLSTWFGNLLVLASVFPEALFTVIAKWYKKDIGSYRMAFLINVFNFLLFLPLAITTLGGMTFQLNLALVALISVYSLVGGVVFFVFWYKGLEQTSASVAAIFTAVMPISASFFAYLFLHETMTRYDVIGVACVIASIVFGAMNLQSVKIKTLLFND